MTGIRIGRTSAFRGLAYQCPKCKAHLMVVAATITLKEIRLEAECEPCRLVVGREFTLAKRTIGELMSLSFVRDECRCDDAFDCPHIVREIGR